MRARITRVAVSTCVLALLLFLVPLGVAVHLLNVAEARSSLETIGLRTAVRVDPAFTAGDRPEIPLTPGFDVALYDAAGKRVAGVGPARPDGAARVALSGNSTSFTSGTDLAVAIPLSTAETVTGAIRVSTPMSGVWARTAWEWGALLLLAAVAMGGGIILARTLAARLSRPIAELVDGAVRMGNGSFRTTLGMSGVSEMDAAAAALNSTSARLAELMLRERRMSANISHQLRTPLTGLRAVLENAVNIPGTDMKAAARRAIADADRLETTISGIIALERDRPQAEFVDPRTVLDDVEKRWNGVCGSKGRLLHTIVENDTPRAAASGLALDQILDVLVDNAISHGRGPVLVRARATHGMLAFDVEDDGASIPEGFDPFPRGESLSGGSGLGLAIAKTLADDEGGRLLLAERHPRTRFTLLLPSTSGTSSQSY